MGHGNSWKDEAVQSVGPADSVWSPGGGLSVKRHGFFGAILNGAQNTYSGLELFDNMNFCRPCTVVLRGCHVGKTTVGEYLMKAIAAKTGCTVLAFTEATVTEKDKGLPGSRDGNPPNVSVEPLQ